jgi:hypothetical protein
LFTLVITYLVIKYLVITYLVITYLVITYLVIKYLVITYLVITYLVITYLEVMSDFIERIREVRNVVYHHQNCKREPNVGGGIVCYVYQHVT